VATILANPRYTGRQVWNRQRTDKDLADPADVSPGHKDVQRWNLPDGWVISKRPAHPALVSEPDFVAVQDVSAARGPAPRSEVSPPDRRRYLLMMIIRTEQTPAATPSAHNDDDTADPLGERAAVVFADDLAVDRVPSIRAIRDALHVGQPRAQRLRGYLAAIAKSQGENLAA
jgi:hypothetical protein